MREQSYKQAYDKRHDFGPLPDLQPGTSVAVKLDSERGRTKTASVLEECESLRPCLVQTDKGVLRRNRRHLKPLLSAPEASDGTDEEHAEQTEESQTSVLDTDPPPSHFHLLHG